MGKATAAVGGLVAILGPLLGLYIPLLGMWNFSNVILTVPTTAWFDVLGSYHWQIGSFSGVFDPNQVVQICGYILLAGGVVTVLGGLAGSRGFTGFGIILLAISLAIFAIMLQGVLNDGSYFLIRPYDSNYSIYMTVNQSLPLGQGPLTQMLGGGFWIAAIGAIIGLIGIGGMKKK